MTTLAMVAILPGYQTNNNANVINASKMNIMCNDRTYRQGFTLIQMSVILTVAALAMVAILPGYRNTSNANGISDNKMNTVMSALRQYEVTHGNLPCPADPTIAIGNSNYGIAAANAGTTSDCIGGSPAAAYADTTKNIAIGMVPVRTLGLSYDTAMDGYGRDITYVVDTNATGCWATSTLPGAVTVTDNGVNQNTVVALVSHGADGYGAWLPAQGTGITGTGQRLNNGSTDTSEAANAEVATGGGLTALTAGNFVNLVNQPATSTFDDLVIYKNRLFNLNSLPVTNANATISPTNPPSGTYTNSSTPNYLTFYVTVPNAVTVSTGGGAPYLTLSALSCSGSTSIGGSTGCNATAQATYSGATGTPVTSLTFTYYVGSQDNAPSGISVAGGITVPNGSSITGNGSSCFPSENLPGVILSSAVAYVYVTDMLNNRIQGFDKSGNYVLKFGSSGTGNGQFAHPAGVFVDSSGNVWVADTNNNRIQKCTISGTTAACTGVIGCGYQGVHTGCSVSSPYIGGSGSANGELNSPEAVAVDSSGNIYVVDQGNNRVQKFNTSYGVSLTLGTATPSGANGNFWTPAGVAIDPSGNIWVTDQGNNRVEEFNSAGTFQRSLGYDSTSGTHSYSGFNCETSPNTSCGGCTSACGIGSSSTHSGQFNSPQNVASDSAGNIYVTDTGNNRIQEFTKASTYTTISSFSLDSSCLSIDTSGNIWASTQDQNKIDYCVSGSCTTYGGGGNGNGQFNGPMGISFTPLR